MSITVDFIKQLREAKFTEEQAEAVVRIIEQNKQEQTQIAEQQSRAITECKTELTKLTSKELASKSDIHLLQKEIKEIELKIQNEISNTKIQTLIWIGVNTAFMLGIIAKGFHWW